MIDVTDQLGRKIQLVHAPQRIVSLVPSLTEALVDIGLEDQIVGITKFCVHPSHLRTVKSNIGGTKNPNIQKILDLKPDIIFANKEENRQEDIDLLANDTAVYITDIKTVRDTIDWMVDLQVIFSDNSKEISSWILKLEKIDQYHALPKNKKVIYLIWKDPYMCAGSDTFIHHMLNKYGFENAIGERRYPILTEEELLFLNPNYLFLSSEPYPFGEKHISAFQKLLPNTNIQLVDGEMFSWYGTRIIKADEYLRRLVQD